jgi:hypothetical protein
MTEMKIFDFKVRDDYGKDYYFTFLKGQKYSLLQVSFSVCEYVSFPHLQIIMGMGKLFGIFFYAWKFGFDVDVFGRTWWL